MNEVPPKSGTTPETHNFAHRIDVNGIPLEITRHWLRIARLVSETWIEERTEEEYVALIGSLRALKTGVDIFTFSQKIPRVKPRFRYPVKWENAAAIPLTTYQDWLGSLSTEMRKDLKRAVNRGVVTKIVELDDELVTGIIAVHDEAAVRQGKAFTHFGKDHDTVKKDYSSFIERSAFIAAYSGTEMIGIIKVVYIGTLACIMQILTKIAHYDKRPTNALIAKTVDFSIQRGSSYLTYGELYYKKQTRSSLADFKVRNGFECIRYPRYYVPLTLRGRIGVRLKLHEGFQIIVPKFAYSFLVDLRTAIRSSILRNRGYRGRSD